MRTLFISFILFLLVLPFTNGKKTVDEYRIMSCNIRITGLEDDAPFPERVWENRRDLCVNTILKRQPDFFCMQEVIYDSYEYFKQKCKKYTSYGFVGPEMDPYTNGYHFIGKMLSFSVQISLNLSAADATGSATILSSAAVCRGVQTEPVIATGYVSRTRKLADNSAFLTYILTTRATPPAGNKSKLSSGNVPNMPITFHR